MFRYFLLNLCFVCLVFCYDCGMDGCKCGSVQRLKALKCLQTKLREFPKGIANDTQFM